MTLCGLSGTKPITVKNKYHIPLMVDLFDRLGGVIVFTKIDMKIGYWQVRITEEDEHKATCVIRHGSYDFLAMPFGLTNAPATFCTLMNQVFRYYIDEFEVVYFDDIVVYSKILEEYLKHLRKVLARLWEHKLYVKLSKCSLGQKHIDFLRHVIEEGRIKMGQRKIQGVTDWSPPKDINALRVFLGLCNFYR
uniref:RNA-directed DNA polymerase homolog n=1 Tax=Nicotiana tabacum TaxID=4097 RepID=A0A1S3XVJ8_TOBAC|nr:PREDICTED: RNA-directed DNA polymerase homolog [Nicotiana tabacum]